MVAEFPWEEMQDHMGRRYWRALVPGARLAVDRNIQASRSSEVTYSWRVLFGGVRLDGRKTVATREDAQSNAEFMYRVVMAGREAIEGAKRDG